MTSNDTVLRRSLAINGLFSIVSGLVSLVFADAISDFMGIHPLVLRFVGVGVLIFGAAVYWFSRHDNIEPGFAWFTTIADLAWVIGTAVLIFSYPDLMSSGGNSLAGILAVAVLLFAIGQFVGLKKVSA
ncbi:MAG: hypothetical protein U9N56_02425 [Actinomycetota bacterium]|nr:hypothetical protein [Actinomycetota bacterium]